MIYPIVLYGDMVLKKKAKDIPVGTDITELISDMFETMQAASGVGLAAPQIGKSVRLFVMDDNPMMDDGEVGIRRAFINAKILEESGEPWVFEEGCLSIPNIREDVRRNEVVKLKYYDENWVEHIEEFDDIHARVIQHEYDHIDGILFTDHISSFKKRLIKGKLANISKGKVDAEYRVKIPAKR